MSRSALAARDYVEHMLDSCKKIQRFIKGKSLDEFFQDDMVQDAVMFNLQVLGEAARQLMFVLPDAHSRFPTIPFNEMYVTRNRLIHGYASIQPRIVWEVAEREIPAVRAALEATLSAWPAELP